MRKPSYLELRGAHSVLAGAMQHICLNPWQPGWYAPLSDKHGNAKPVDEALIILKNAIRVVLEAAR